MVAVAETLKNVTWHKQVTRLLVEIEKQANENDKKPTRRNARRPLCSLPLKRISLPSLRISF
jgi:hypothetical protein